MNFNNINAVVFDFDGVFTDNRVIISEDGKEFVICNRSDGIGLELLRSIGIPLTIVSTEKSPVVAFRAEKLKLPVVHGVINKIKEIEKFSIYNNVDYENIAFVGNDINDAECMQVVGFPIAVADAVESIKKIASYILERNGGDCAVREICELIYNAKKNE